MSLIKYIHTDGDEFVTEEVTTDAQTAEIHGHLPYRILSVTVGNGQISNGNTDTETVTVEVINGLEVARGTDRENATVLDYDGDVTLSIDGVETTKTLTDGSLSFNITTQKSAGSIIEIVAESLSDHPTESDSATIEVVSA